MPIKLLLAKPATHSAVSEAAQLQFEIWHDEEPQCIHKLKLFRNADGSWKPELTLDISCCVSPSIPDILVSVSKILNLTSKIIIKESVAVTNLAKWL